MSRTHSLLEHPALWALMPTAQRLVGAIREDDPAEFLEQIAAAEKAVGHGWQTVLIYALAAMVPDNATPGQLTFWMHHATPDYPFEMEQTA